MSLRSFACVYFLGASYTEGWSGEDFMLEEAARFLGDCFNLGSLPRDAETRIQVKKFV